MVKVMAVCLLSVYVFCAGCATMLKPGPQDVSVMSDPAGANIYLDDMPVGTTPSVVRVASSSNGIFRIEKEGYVTKVIDRDKVLNGWFFPGNLLWLLIWPAFPVAMTVDLATYNQGMYENTPIIVKFNEGNSAEISNVPVVEAP